MPSFAPHKQLSLVIILLLLMGGLLRFMYLGEIPFFNDELSALSRLEFPNFAALIEEGVKPDGHPAAVQVFLFYWKKWVGMDEFMLRLPFVITSLISLYLIFLLARRWFHDSAALLATAFMAFTQYPLFFGIQIRPYAPGLCLVLAFTWFWDKWRVEETATSKWLFWAGMVISGAGTAYVHYFAGLEVIVLSMMGLFFVKRSDRIPFVGAGLAMLLLYLPHWNIFLAQLETGGIGGWLAPPKWNFLRDYLSYLLHHSWLFGTFILFSWMLGVSQKYHLGVEKRAYRRYAGLAFLLPLVVGYLYSYRINPVLHEGSLYFAFPFLLLFVASFIPKMLPKWELIMVLMLGLLGLGSLVVQRQHYKVMLERGNEQVVRDSRAWEQEVGEDFPRLMVQNDTFYRNIYLDSSSSGVFLPYPENYVDFHQRLRGLEGAYLSLSWVNKPLPLTYVAIAREYFPYVKERRLYFTSEFYGLSTEAGGAEEKRPLLTRRLEVGRGDSSLFIQGRRAEEIEEYSRALEIEKDSLGEGWTFRQYWFSADFWGQGVGGRLVLSFEEEKEGEWVSLYRQEVSLKDFAVDAEAWNRAHLVIRGRHTSLRGKEKAEGVKLKAYVWNRGGSKMKIANVKVEVWEENPVLYGLFEPLR